MAVSHQLAELCCLDGRLPQGAPTSPALANSVFKPLDVKLRELADGWDCEYTRYADDLAFSGSRKFSIEDVRAVNQILLKDGFQLQEKKQEL